MPFSTKDIIEQRPGDKKPMPAKIPSARGEFPFNNKFKTHTIDHDAFRKEVDRIKQARENGGEVVWKRDRFIELTTGIADEKQHATNGY